MELLQLGDVDVGLHFFDVFDLQKKALHDVGLSTQLRMDRLKYSFQDCEHELGLKLHDAFHLLKNVFLVEVVSLGIAVEASRVKLVLILNSLL